MHCFFGRIENDAVVLSAIGRIAHDCWRDIPNHFSRVAVDPFVVMPNHVHGIVTIEDGHGSAVPLQVQHRPEGFQKAVPGSIPTILRSYKGAVTCRARRHVAGTSLQVWQSNYFERVLRSGMEVDATSRYILDNPKMWHFDKTNPFARKCDEVNSS
jgi:putative transposase